MRVSDNKRKHTFDAFHTERVASREALVRTALGLLGGRFETLSALAKNTARLVTELERKQAKDGEEPRPVSYTTLIRKGSKYKHILLAHFDGVGTEEQSDQESELEELRLHCVHLEHDNALLRNRLASIGVNSQPETVSESRHEPSRREDIEMLIDLIDGIMGETKDLFLTVGPSDIDELHPDPGLYSAYDELIAEYDSLLRLRELRNEVK